MERTYEGSCGICGFVDFVLVYEEKESDAEIKAKVDLEDRHRALNFNEKKCSEVNLSVYMRSFGNDEDDEFKGLY